MDLNALRRQMEAGRSALQACLRSRDAKQDIPVPLSHSIFDGLFVPPYALPQPRLRTSFLGSAPSRLPQWLDGAFAVLALFPLWRFARRGNSLASRLRGTTRLVLRTSVAGSGGAEIPLLEAGAETPVLDSKGQRCALWSRVPRGYEMPLGQGCQGLEGP